jgi:hypothetical protein
MSDLHAFCSEWPDLRSIFSVSQYIYDVIVVLVA